MAQLEDMMRDEQSDLYPVQHPQPLAYSREDTAKVTGLSPATIDRLIFEGEIPAARSAPASSSCTRI